MYFLKYFSQNFHFILRAEGGEGGSGAPSESVRPEARPSDLREQALKNLTPEQQKRLEDLEAIKKEVEGLQASEKIVGARLDVIGKRLLQIKENPTEKANPEDKEYEELVAMFERLEVEYKTIAADNAQTSHILSFYLQEFSGEVDEQIGDIWEGHNEELDDRMAGEEIIFTAEKVQELETTRNDRKEIVQKILISYLGEKYTGGDIGRYSSDFANSELQSFFERYQHATKLPDENMNLNERGDVLSNDIFELTNIAQEMSIVLRDGKEINGKEFGDIREEYLESSYEDLLKTDDEQILDIISPKNDVGERDPKSISELSSGDILALREAGFDTRKLLFITNDGKEFDPESLKQGSVFIVNIGDNLEAGMIGLHHFENRPNTISVDGLRAEYREKDGDQEAGYYGENGRIELSDGAQIKVLEMGDEENKTHRDEAQSPEKDTLMQSSAGREMYRQALENPDKPIQAKGWLAKILLTVLEVLTGKKLLQEEDGTFKTQNESGEWTPVTGAEYIEKYRGEIRSHPIERSSSGTTLCGRTAFKNLQMLGAKNPQLHDAHVLLSQYQSSGLNSNIGFPQDVEESTETVQLFMDASKENAAKGYRHTACAFKDESGSWFVLDPYYGMNGKGTATREPIPAGVYMNYMRGTLGKQFYGAFDV